MNPLIRFLLATFVAALLLAGRAEAQTTSTWANSNVNGTPAPLLDWFTGGPNTQGTWTGGDPVSSNLNTIQFFENTTTALPNTALPSSQAVNLNNGGSAFELGTLTLSGLGSATTNANLTMTLSGDALNFSAATGTLNLNALNDTRTITYNVNNDIQLGTASSASALTVGGAGTGTFVLGGIISELQSGGGSLVKTGTSAVSLAGANTYTGTTSITGGGLVLDYSTQDNSKLSDSAALTLGAAALVIKGGSHTETVASTTLSAGGSTISRDGGTSVLQLNAITRADRATLAFGESSIATTDTLNVNGILGGWATIGNDWAINSTNGPDGAITALASYDGALPTALGASDANYTLTGSQTQTAPVAANSVKITGTGTLQLGTHNLVITSTSATSSGGILYAGGTDDNYSINRANSGRIVPSGTSPQELIFQITSGTLTSNVGIGNINSGDRITKNGAGTLVLTVTSSLTGGLRVNQGAVRFMTGAAAGFGSGARIITVQSGAALELANSITTADYDLTLNGGGISNAGALRNISGTNTFPGIVTLVGDTRINSDAGTLNLTGGTLSGSGTITGSGFGLTIGGAGNTSISSIIGTVAGTLTKDGAGTLTLTAANTYTGSTTVSAGTLFVNGSLAAGSAVSVGVSGTLGGTGTISGPTTILGAHTPGNSPGIQTFASDLTYSGGSSTVEWELSGNTITNVANPNAVYDQILVGGNLDFAAATSLSLLFNGAGSSVLWADAFWDAPQQWTLYDVTGSTTGFGNLSLAPGSYLDSGSISLASARSSASFSLVQSGNDVVVSYVAVPEPGGVALAGLGLAAAAFAYRRRRIRPRCGN